MIRATIRRRGCLTASMFLRARSIVWALTAVVAAAPVLPARAGRTLASEPDASTSAAVAGQGADPATSPDPAIRQQAGREALRGAGVRAQARAIGESLIRDFPGTVHAVAGLMLVLQATPLRGADRGLLVAVKTLESRLAEIVAAAPSPTPSLEQAVAELRLELAWARGMVHLDLGRAGDDAAIQACARTFAEIVRSLGPKHPRTPLALWNAGETHMLAHDLEAARAYFGELLDRHPNADIAERSLTRLIDIAGALARVEELATLLELHAARYPRSSRAADSIREAVAIRLALRQEQALRADVAAAERLYAGKDPAMAARYYWVLGETATTDAERRAHAEAYMRRYRNAGGADRLLVAEARLAAIDWRGSCPGGQVNGLCVAPPARTRGAAKVRRCAEPTTPSPRPRTGKLADAARARLGRIVKAAGGLRIAVPEEERRRIDEFVDAVGLSRIAALDGELEAFMAIAMPTGLRLEVDRSATGEVRKRQQALREDSVRRLRTYLDTKWARGAALVRAYDELRAETRSTPAILAAAYRTAVIAEHMADQLISAEVPRELAGTPTQAVYCAELRERAAPYLEQARNAYAYCAERASVSQTITDASQACDAAIARLDPKRWPPLVEFVGQPTPAGELPPRSAGVQLDPPPVDAVSPRQSADDGIPAGGRTAHSQFIQ